MTEPTQGHSGAHSFHLLRPRDGVSAKIGALDPQEAKLAIVKPARDKGADYIPEATDEIVEQTRGYPYFLQEWVNTLGTLQK